MKAKSSYHRSENQFKFQTFAERLGAVNVDVARRVQKISATPEDAETFFGEALDKWSELNCTLHFVAFRREIANQIQSLAQLIHHKDAIVEALQRHLQVENSLAYQPLLDLVVQLARDLQGDFYPYFPSFFAIIVSVLNAHHHDTEILEQAFTCLAYIFKFLWRTMLKDLQQVYSIFKPLLGKEHRHYINNFAAESFAFLIRKSKDHEELFKYIFKGLDGNPDQAAGVGHLMFETVKGVQKQFHSVTEKLLSTLLSQLCDEGLPQQEVAAALMEMWNCMAGYASPQTCRPVWDAMLAELQMLHKAVSVHHPAPEVCSAMVQVLSVLRSWVQYKSGLLVTPVEELCQVLLALFSGHDLPSECMSAALDVTADLLLSTACNIPMHIRPKLIKQVYQCECSQQLLFDFTKCLHDLPLYEKDLLPEFLGYCHHHVISDKSTFGLVLHALAQLVMHKSPPVMSGDQDIMANNVPLDFTPHTKKNAKSGIVVSIQKLISSNATKLSHDTENLSELWAAVMCVSHVKISELSALQSSLLKLSHTLREAAATSLEQAELLSIWAETVISLMKLQEPDTLYKDISVEHITGILRSFPSNVDVLRVASLYFCRAVDTAAAEDVLKNEVLLSVFDQLLPNLSQPYSQIRLLTLQICCQFHVVMPTLPDDMEVNQIGVFAICLAAEQITVNVQTYRERLVHLHKLDWGVLQNQIPVGPFHLVGLHYLLGTLYLNFTYLWEPVMEILASHARNMDKADFWKVYEHHLQEAASKTEKLLLLPNKQHLVTHAVKSPSAEPVPDSLSGLFQHHWDHEASFHDRPDQANYRILLWRAMQHFSECCEPRSRIIVPLFFRFLDNEYYPADLSMARTQDISKVEEDAEVGMDADVDEEDEDGNTLVNDGKKKKQKRAPNKTCVVHLQLFAKFRKPRSLYGEPRLTALYHDLLFHRALELQKVAFTCLMTYGNKALMPYKENFERLLDDKSFKNEIVLFSIDSEQSVVKVDHRAEVLPVLMRILYGKMQTKTGKDTSGRAQSHIRKNMVLRFLAGCRPDELQVFLDLVFEPYKHFVSDDLMEKLKIVCSDTDITKVIPLRKQQSMLSTVDIVIKKLGHLMGPYFPKIVQMVVCVLGLSAHLLEQRENLRPSAVNVLKAIRQLAVVRINQFMQSFTQYAWPLDHIDGLFTAAVWPQITKLPHEGIYSPTGLLNLLHTWTQYKHYMILLGKCQPEDAAVTPLPFIFQLLHSPHANSSVVKVIMSIIDNLLDDGEDEEEAMDIGSIEAGSVVTFPQPELSVGVNLLLCHVPTILDYLRKVVEKMNAAEGRLSTLPIQELNILARLSEYVEDVEQSGRIITLLLPFLANNLNRSPDLEVSVLQAVRNLLQRVKEPIEYLPSTTKLFSTLSARVSRAALCEALKVIGERNKEAQFTVDLVTKLNAWDRRYVEEPDYMVRLDGYQLAQTRLKQEEPVDATLLLMLVHNCCFMLNTTEDMSLRDSSSLCLQALVKHVSRHADHQDLFQLVIVKSLLPLVREGIKHKLEVSRHEFIHLLGHLVMGFPNYPVFQDLGKLLDKHDPEVDFFDNITHIQMHRRGRAMKRLAKQMGSLKFSNDCVLSYLLPIITSFLKDESYAKHSNIIDCAIEAIGAICRVLPWPRYCGVLRHYLTLLPKSLSNQKIMVRIVVTILDSFHFDLQQSKEMGTSSFAAQEGKSQAESEKSLVTKETESDDKMDEEAQDEDNTMVGMESEQEESAVTAFQICPAGLATRIHNVILRNIIPQLHRCLTQKAKSDDEHKAAQVSKYAEDEEILRVPIALAMVKLLQHMPHKTLEHTLPGVLLKVCTFLRSRAVDIRNTARDTLLKILQSLGPSYFSFVLTEMRGSLKRGYQLHVLCYTVYMLLNNLTTLKPGDLDNCVHMLVQVFNEELFGHVAEEKDVEGITSKLFEARTSKSFESYGLLGKYLTKTSLPKVVVPLKEVLDTTHSHKVTRKVQEVLRRLSHGLVDNTGIELCALLTFTYGLANDALPLLKQNKDKEPQAEKEADPRLQPTSTYIIQDEAPRGGHKTKTQAKTNVYVIIEFGLQVLNLLLKRSLLVSTNMEHLKMLDPFVKSLAACLKAKNVKVTATALRCLIWLFKFPLPGMKKQITNIAKSLFVLLHNYASVGAGKGDNFELVVMCFKAMTVLVRDIQYHSINTKQLQVLLGYAEQDIHDYSRQATAFTLLKAILSRKLVVREMADVMRKVQQLSITADSAHVRLQSRQVMLTYLLDYPLGAKLQQHLEFYLTQLDYEHETGRQSSLEMMATMFETFPPKVLVNYASFFFVPLASRLLNDDSAKCRKLAALAVKSLLSKLDNSQREKLFAIAVQWLQGAKVQIRHLGALSLGLVVEVEGTKFERHLQVVLPIIEHQTMPDKYDQGSNEEEARALDHLLFAVLTLLMKVLRECPIIRKDKWAENLGNIWGHVEQHLLHPHAWVRLGAAQLLGMLFAAWTPADVVTLTTSAGNAPSSCDGYLEQSTTNKLHNLCGAFVKQLSSPQMEEELADQIIKNLVFLGKVLAHMPDRQQASANGQSDGDADDLKQEGQGHWVSLTWLIKRLCREAKAETANNVKATIKRSSVFKWMAAVAMELGESRLVDYLLLFLPPLVGELHSNATTEDASLRSLCQEVVEIMKRAVGVEVFTPYYAKAQKSLAVKKDTRKRQRAMEAVSNPEIAAKRRVKKNLSKKEAKKRRIEELRPSKKLKKQKTN